MYLAEQKAREAVETRARIQHELLNNQKERKEDELRKLAQQARMDRVGGNAVSVPQDHDHGKECNHLSFESNAETIMCFRVGTNNLFPVKLSSTLTQGAPDISTGRDSSPAIQGKHEMEDEDEEVTLTLHVRLFHRLVYGTSSSVIGKAKTR